jgi:myo-inositol 2-dehydrogenase / D-chiro-inositol 1-dehydrogenase
VISTGMIGCGDVAEYGHLPAMLAHDRFRPVAVCDISPARAQLLANRAGGVHTYKDWRELLDNEKLDAVVLALPPEVSPAIVEECLDRGLAVLDEKPLAASVAAGRRLATIIGDRDCVYQVGFVLRYGDWVQDIQAASAGIGSPLQINVDIFDERFDAKNFVHLARIQGFLRNSSALTHEGSHVIDYVGLWRNANWSRVAATSRRTLDIFDGPNVWNARIDFEDATSLELQVGWLLDELPPSTVDVRGPLGRLHFNLATGRGELDALGSLRPLNWKPITAEWQRQYDAFAEAIDAGRATRATVHDALRALEITAACELAARKGCEITRAEFVNSSIIERQDERHAWPTPPLTAIPTRIDEPSANRRPLMKEANY